MAGLRNYMPVVTVTEVQQQRMMNVLRNEAEDAEQREAILEDSFAGRRQAALGGANILEMYPRLLEDNGVSNGHMSRDLTTFEVVKCIRMSDVARVAGYGVFFQQYRVDWKILGFENIIQVSTGDVIERSPFSSAALIPL